MSDLLTRRGAIARILPAGPARSDDAAVYTTGTVGAVDPVAATVQVSVRGGTVTLPAVADRYVPGGLARVLIDPIRTRPVLVVGAVDPAAPAAVIGVMAVGTGTVTVLHRDKQVTIPTTSGTYTAGQSAWVVLDEWGGPVVAVGPSTAPAPGWAPPPAPPAAGTVPATATVGPQDSATWRAAYSRWDSWNTNRYGGASDVYQGNGAGSGQLWGWAGFGDQIVNLGAVTIQQITLTVKKTDVNGLSAALTVDGTGTGVRPPGGPVSGGWGATSTPRIGPGEWGSLVLSAPLVEAFRTGAAKGLVAIGSDYGAFGGTGTPGSFVLQVNYTKNA